MNVMKFYSLNSVKVRSLLPKRRKDAHKGNAGKLLLLCGSRGYTGAASLAATGALRSGAGLVYLGVPESIYQIEAIKLTEPIVFPLPDQNGMLSEHAIEDIASILQKVDAVLIGPGIGISKDTERVTEYVLKNFPGPVILDADGISLMRLHKDILRDRTGATVITPHEGEFARFFEKDVGDRALSAVEVALDTGLIVVLKGHNTIITDGRKHYINKTGNPGMAVGGSGDVLAGVITGLIGQGLAPLTAAACGVWLHGAAGDICARKLGVYGMLPSDMLQVLPRLMK